MGFLRNKEKKTGKVVLIKDFGPGIIRAEDRAARAEYVRREEEALRDLIDIDLAERMPRIVAEVVQKARQQFVIDGTVRSVLIRLPGAFRELMYNTEAQGLVHAAMMAEEPRVERVKIGSSIYHSGDWVPLTVYFRPHLT